MAFQTLLVVAFLVVLALAAPRYGVDSREPPPGELPRPQGPPHRPTVRGDLRALSRTVRQAFRTCWTRVGTSRPWPLSSRRSASKASWSAGRSGPRVGRSPH